MVMGVFCYLQLTAISSFPNLIQTRERGSGSPMRAVPPPCP